VHIDPEVEQAKVAAGVVLHKHPAVDLVSMGHDIGHVAMLIGDQGIEGDVFAGLLGADDGAAREIRANFQRESVCGPDRNKIRLEGSVCLLFIAATAFAGNSQTDDSNKGGTDQELPHQFPQFYGTQF